MRIDPHVHCRDGRQAHKETIAHVMALCDAQGVDQVFDMPNTDPPLLTEQAMLERLALVPREAAGRYRLYLGLTTDERQVREAVRLAGQAPAVAGLKLYAGPSTGALGMPAAADQRRLYQVLADAGYQGVLAVHAEKSDLLSPTRFDPGRPASHGAARPPAAEAAAIDDQVAFAAAAGFRGTLHICHLSTAAGLERVQTARRTLALTCGVTPHHLLWTGAMLARGPEGLLYKVNPPLREPADTIALRQALKAGAIDWIETDHAPHALSEKLYAPYESGYPSLCLYRSLVEDILPYWGLHEATIRAVTGDTIRRVFDRKDPSACT